MYVRRDPRAPPTEHATWVGCTGRAGAKERNRKERVITTYLPVVPCNWSGNGRQGFGTVEALHILVANVRDGCDAAVVGSPSKAGIRRPWVGVVGVCGRVLLGGRLAGGPLSLAQSSGDTDGGPGLVDALVAGEGQMCVAR